jgi:regulator of sigma E protease
MESLFNLLWSYILPFILVLGLLIFFHEFGHFSLAKLVGIRVERFSLGFPPRLIGKKIGETDYCISAVPFGGYVKMSGMIDESMDETGIKGEPYEFMSKPIWVRFLVIAAGPLFNILLTAIIFSISIAITGVPEAVGPVVNRVGDGMPAEQAGIVSGDRIIRINDNEITEWSDLVNIIHNAPGEPLEIAWEHEGTVKTETITPLKDELQEYGYIGIEPKTVSKSVGVFTAVGMGVDQTVHLTQLVFRSFGLLISGDVSVKQGLAGPVRIAQMAGDSAKGGFNNLMVFTAFLSLNLGILNLLPFPVLDGGHLVLLLGEAVIRRPISTRIRLVIQQIGMAVLLALMILVIVNDVINIL